MRENDDPKKLVSGMKSTLDRINELSSEDRDAMGREVLRQLYKAVGAPLPFELTSPTTAYAYVDHAEIWYIGHEKPYGVKAFKHPMPLVRNQRHDIQMQMNEFAESWVREISEDAASNEIGNMRVIFFDEKNKALYKVVVKVIEVRDILTYPVDSIFFDDPRDVDSARVAEK